ncbi:Macrolide export ATP-binding/permease protein MacB [Labilithrix luteola]|uniref:Macrolide export ATP-binding/permease protein MacB n=1 Tax=Labilithrix luteola TaxID=1391654 RepID=A0A0K1QH33_9BACT|nr:ABC transporter permease [Labilithrix luteola]AKV04735.1 Macrolide export ATP-binding/permease protein MacB [Labilithrix luteola]
MLQKFLPREFLDIAVGVRLAMRAISRSILRASLTILGILIGVSAVVTVTAIGAGARDQVTQQISNIGSNVIMIAPQSAAASGAKGALGSGTRLTEEDGKAIVREAVSVSAVAPALRAKAQIVAGEKNWSTQIIGSNRSFFTVRSWPVVHGAEWDEHDEATKSKVCVLGSTVATKLFGDADPVGRTVRIGRHVYRVLGVLESKGEAQFGGDQDDMVLMPISSMRGRVIRTAPGFAGVLLVSAKSADTTQRAVGQISSILRQRHRIAEDREPDFWIRTQQEFQQMQQAIYGGLTALLVCIAAVSLVVGGIGVMNIMLVSVTERTREIGIRMAIGARAGDVMIQFLVEAVFLALIGGVLGALVGIGAIQLLSGTLGWPMKLDPVALGIAVATSALTGVAFGFFPARRAARLDPIFALRHE